MEYRRGNECNGLSYVHVPPVLRMKTKAWNRGETVVWATYHLLNERLLICNPTNMTLTVLRFLRLDFHWPYTIHEVRRARVLLEWLSIHNVHRQTRGAVNIDGLILAGNPLLGSLGLGLNRLCLGNGVGKHHISTEVAALALVTDRNIHRFSGS